MISIKELIPKIVIKSTLKRFLLFYLPAVAVIACLTATFYFKDIRNSIEHISEHKASLIELQSLGASDAIEMVASDLKVLTSHDALTKFLNTGEGFYLRILADEFLLFSSAKKNYDQICFINNKGDELVRVDFNNGKPSVVALNKLQNKADRYYFREAIGFEKDQIYVSLFDLNIENGEIELPLKPMLRFALPVLDSGGRKKGILVVNYIGQNIINRFTDSSDGEITSQVFLLNTQGFYLKGSKPEDAWGFILGERKDKLFGKSFSGAWKVISRDEQGQFYTPRGLFTFTTISPISLLNKSYADPDRLSGLAEDLEKFREYDWKVVSYIPISELNSVVYKDLLKIIILFILGIALLGVIVWALSRFSEIKKEIDEKNEIIHVVRGANATTLITTEDFLEKIKSKFKNEILKLSKNQVEIILKSSTTLESVPGVTAYIYSLFGDNNINIQETLSCWTDTIIIINKDDLAKTMDLLNFE